VASDISPRRAYSLKELLLFPFHVMKEKKTGREASFPPRMLGGDGGELNSRTAFFGRFSTRFPIWLVAPAALPTANERHRSFISVHGHPF
jgi:hypothetical protein